ncbi:GspH/FimT family pseudopilin [Sphingomonas jatrophae]|uniref:Type II secretion system protein H n=1 Tax=Sphingomonas jatrophae TaxID=1166337 RepID=A0A1I6JCY3_9SPHN|nr:GspH/FimT family pseudopilin [Sphingomonas jatrophae]SFR76885.1 general secretion pathway protein H [Sphingomonas jatrophae]
MAPRRHDEAGFTLVELMVVLVIMALSSAAVLFMLPDPRGGVRADAERFAARVRAAQDGAILSGRPVALTLSRAGYRFDERVRGRWAAPSERALASRTWGEGVTAAVGGEGRVLFDPTGAVEPLALTLAREDERIAVRIEGDGRVHVG